jgi:hypothetical protein
MTAGVISSAVGTVQSSSRHGLWVQPLDCLVAVMSHLSCLLQAAFIARRRLKGMSER